MTATAQSDAHSSSISTGAIAGAAVGSLVLLLLLLGLGFWLVRRRRRSARTSQATDASDPHASDGAETQHQQYIVELSGHDRKLYPYELHGVPTSITRVELEAPANVIR